MLKYFVLSLYLLSLLWQNVHAEDSDFTPEIEGDNFELGESNEVVKAALKPRFIQVKENEKVFSIYFLSVNWHTAREFCTSLGKTIASINAQEENKKLEQAMALYGFLPSDSAFWIGGSQVGHPGLWSWANTGGPIYYSNWRNGIPTNNQNLQCMEFLGNGKWNNNDCDQRKAFICEDLPSCSTTNS